MDHQVIIEKEALDKIAFGRIVDTQFHQLINNVNVGETPTFTLEEFFQMYEDLFYQIPKEGDAESHQYILQKEADYLGVIINQDDIQALLDEITTLRQQLLDAQTALDEINKTIRITNVTK